MSAIVIDVRSAEDPRDVIHRAVQALVEGKLVAFPTETVYGLAASALSEHAVDALVEAKGRDDGRPLTLAVKSVEEALDYVPDMQPLARRLARRCWPGPVTLVVDDAHEDSLIRRLPQPVQQTVSPQGTLGLRVPAHAAIQDVLRLLPGPVVLSSANRSGQPDAITADGVVDSLGDQVFMVIDDGPCRYGLPSSVVRVRGNQFEVLRAGAVSEANLRRLSSFLLLFVCTGNTCRSPMAEVLARKRLADRLGCPAEALEDRGLRVMSAGLSAMLGGRASGEATRVMSQMGLNLDDHASQPLTGGLVRHADLILTMTAAHREMITTHWPEAAARTHLVCLDDSDVSDPIGGTTDQYRQCAEQIDRELAARLGALELD